ncbi:MAG: phosphoribosylanthranilate isomerase [Nevskia sp.]|nr:phosphoribosylanthranilate isomerase [Nevskia sp.]
MDQQRTRIKFCGITRLEDLLAGAALGVDAVGFVLAAGSPRRLPLDAAAALRRRLPPLLTAVALLRNPSAAEVRQAIEILRPDLLQFHGDESAEFCAGFGLPYLKAVGMRGQRRPLLEIAAEYAAAAALLLDGHGAGEPGGQGVAFDWSAARDAGKPLILAGGLDAANVGLAIAAARPYAVDVSSGIEAAPGIKDSGKMEAFVRAVRDADTSLSTIP